MYTNALCQLLHATYIWKVMNPETHTLKTHTFEQEETKHLLMCAFIFHSFEYS